VRPARVLILLALTAGCGAPKPAPETDPAKIRTEAEKMKAQDAEMLKAKPKK
jgi:hypothetical protein